LKLKKEEPAGGAGIGALNTTTPLEFRSSSRASVMPDIDVDAREQLLPEKVMVVQVVISSVGTKEKSVTFKGQDGLRAIGGKGNEITLPRTSRTSIEKVEAPKS